MAPVRSCVGCGERSEPLHLVRLVLDENGRVRADAKRRLGGRGVWVHKSRVCVEKVVIHSGLARGFRKKPQPLDAVRLWALVTEEEGI